MAAIARFMNRRAGKALLGIVAFWVVLNVAHMVALDALSSDLRAAVGTEVTLDFGSQSRTGLLAAAAPTLNNGAVRFHVSVVDGDSMYSVVLDAWELPEVQPAS